VSDQTILATRVSNQRDEIFRLHERLAQAEYELKVARMALLMATTYPEDWMKKAKAKVSNKLTVCGATKRAESPAPLVSEWQGGNNG
jgi:hypothetical protein